MHDTTRRGPAVRTVPVMDGAAPAPREARIAGIVQRVWADSLVYHKDVEPLLREWLSGDRCLVTDEEFGVLLAKARGEFERVADAGPAGSPACPAHTLVACLYWDVERLERGSTPPEG
jgi:hypothetical protein